MKGSIIKRKHSYSVIIELDPDPVTAKRRQKWYTAHSSKEADKLRTDKLHQRDTGTYIESHKQTLANYLESWLHDVAYPNLTPLTYEGYEYRIRKHIIPALGNVPLSELKPKHLQKLYSDTLAAMGNKSGVSNRTVQYIHNTLHRTLQHAVKSGLIARNPADAVEAPKVQTHEIRIMSESEIHLFLEYARATPYYALFYLIFFTGLRRSEALALRFCDCNLTLGQINVNQSVHYMKYGTYKGQMIFKTPKSRKGRRMISLSPSTSIVMHEYREAKEKMFKELGRTIEDNDLVFCKPDGRPFLPDSVTRAWILLANRIGLKGSNIHSARHSHATLMLKQGIHPKIVQERLGHSNIQTTLNVYSSVLPGLQEAAALRFDDILLPASKTMATETIR
jgi:integrase